MKLVVLDTETTGLSRAVAPHGTPCAISGIGSEVIQIGGLVLDHKANPVRAFCHYCDCMAPEMSEDARKVNKLSLARIREFVPNVFPEDVLLTRVPELLADDVVVIGHNISFDLQMLSQSTRNCFPSFSGWPRVMCRVPSKGRALLDTMSYFSHRRKLSSFYDEVTPLRKVFYARYGETLPFDTNCPDLFYGDKVDHHNALFDSIETYLVFQYHIWGKKVSGGRL